LLLEEVVAEDRNTVQEVEQVGLSLLLDLVSHQAVMLLL
jgi:hypothetical protein